MSQNNLVYIEISQRQQKEHMMFFLNTGRFEFTLAFSQGLDSLDYTRGPSIIPYLFYLCALIDFSR